MQHLHKLSESNRRCFISDLETRAPQVRIDEKIDGLHVRIGICDLGRLYIKTAGLGKVYRECDIPVMPYMFPFRTLMLQIQHIVLTSDKPFGRNTEAHFEFLTCPRTNVIHYPEVTWGEYLLVAHAPPGECHLTDLLVGADVPGLRILQNTRMFLPGDEKVGSELLLCFQQSGPNLDVALFCMLSKLYTDAIQTAHPEEFQYRSIDHRQSEGFVIHSPSVSVPFKIFSPTFKREQYDVWSVASAVKGVRKTINSAGSFDGLSAAAQELQTVASPLAVRGGTGSARIAEEAVHTSLYDIATKLDALRTQ